MPDASPTHIVKLIQKLRYVAKDILLLSIYKFVVPTFNSDNKNSAIFESFKNDNYIKNLKFKEHTFQWID